MRKREDIHPMSIIPLCILEARVFDLIGETDGCSFSRIMHPHGEKQVSRGLEVAKRKCFPPYSLRFILEKETGSAKKKYKTNIGIKFCRNN